MNFWLGGAAMTLGTLRNLSKVKLHINFEAEDCEKRLNTTPGSRF